MYRAVNVPGLRRFVPVLALLLLNACMAPPPAPVVERAQPPSTRINYHVVSQGETLHTIAWRYELDYRQLISLNGLQPPYQLRHGQRLQLGDSPIPVPAGPARAVAVVESPITSSPVGVDPITPSPGTPPSPSADSGSSLEWVPMTDGEDYAPPADQADPLPEPLAPEPSVADEAPSAPIVADAPPANPAAATGGAWQWPVTGTVSREYDAAKVFKGINIHSTKGTPVKAAGSGTVVYAGSGLRGYGQLIILKHDDTYLSAYAHNSRILVAENDVVSQGQAIGEVGGDPLDSGRLYFEIREHGKPVDPESLLPPRS